MRRGPQSATRVCFGVSMTFAFYLAGAIAVVSTFLAVTRLNAVHALLYFVVSLLSMAFLFLLLGAPFVAALEIIIYAGAIMVLFVFVVMVLSMGPRAILEEREWLAHTAWVGPALLTAFLLIELVWLLGFSEYEALDVVQIGPKEVGLTLLGPYLLGVELVSTLLLIGLVGAYHLAYHLGQRETSKAGRSPA